MCVGGPHQELPGGTGLGKGEGEREAEAEIAGKWLTKLERNHDKTNSILQSVRKTLPSIFGSP